MAQLFGLARLGRDAEVRHTPQGDAVCNLSLAFSYGKRDPNTKERPTQWVDASLWGQRAESLAPYLLKGTLLSVTLDDIHIEEYQTRDGRAGSKIVGRVSSIEFAARPPEQKQQQQRVDPPARSEPPARPAPSLADMDDDIPF